MLREAFRQVRERHQGVHPEPDVTLRRTLLATRKRAKTRTLTRFVLLPIAATLVASTVWAGATGRLGGVAHGVFDAVHDEHEAPAAVPSAALAPAPAPTPAPAPEPEPAPAPAPAAAAQGAEGARSEEGAKPAASDRPAAQPVARVAASAPPASAPPASDKATDPSAHLFDEAHRLHFVDKDSARALDAWDAYLRAAPQGRFVPEARYNRALALVRLGRTSEAAQELRAFATGTYGEYRRDDARALLEAIEHDARSP